MRDIVASALLKSVVCLSEIGGVSVGMDGFISVVHSSGSAAETISAIGELAKITSHSCSNLMSPRI